MNLSNEEKFALIACDAIVLSLLEDWDVERSHSYEHSMLAEYYAQFGIYHMRFEIDVASTTLDTVIVVICDALSKSISHMHALQPIAQLAELKHKIDSIRMLQGSIVPVMYY